MPRETDTTQLLGSIDTHLKDYAGLVGTLNNTDLFASPNPLLSMEREADRTRAVLIRALECAYGSD